MTVVVGQLLLIPIGPLRDGPSDSEPKDSGGANVSLSPSHGGGSPVVEGVGSVRSKVVGGVATNVTEVPTHVECFLSQQHRQRKKRGEEG